MAFLKRVSRDEENFCSSTTISVNVDVIDRHLQKLLNTRRKQRQRTQHRSSSLDNNKPRPQQQQQQRQLMTTSVRSSRFVSDCDAVFSYRNSGTFASLGMELDSIRRFPRGWSVEQQQLKETSTFTQQQRAELRRKFLFVAKLVVLLRRLSLDQQLSNKSDDELFSGILFVRFDDSDDDDISQSNQQQQQQQRPKFNPIKYKANRRLRITEEARRILSKQPADRTSQELDYVQAALQSSKSYAEYPIRMQRNIARVGMYERYGSRRIVLRQGHPTSAFYFILSGSVVCTVRDHPTAVPQPKAILHKGMTFGELAIIHRTTRQSTLVAIEPVELMSIGVEDFHDIFMLGGFKNVNDPDHQKFLNNLRFLDGWPTAECLTNETKNCVFHYFRRGDILVKDSRHYNWLVIVKSGSLRVLKKLQRTIEPENSTRTTYNNSSESSSSPDDVGNLAAAAANDVTGKRLQQLDKRIILNELNVPLRPDSSPSDDVTHADVTTTTIFPPLELSGRGEQRSMGVANVPRKLLDKSGTSDCELENRKLLEVNGSDEWRGKERDHLPSIHRQSKQRRERQTNVKDAKGNRYYRRESGFGRLLLGNRQQIRTIASDLDSENSNVESTAADLHPQFVQVQTLVKGDVFGLTETILGPQPSFSVISNGAECVLINRSFFLRHAPDSLIKRLQITCSPYPTDEEMQRKLKCRVDWNQFVATTFAQTIQQLRGSTTTTTCSTADV